MHQRVMPGLAGLTRELTRASTGLMSKAKTVKAELGSINRGLLVVHRKCFKRVAVP